MAASYVLQERGVQNHHLDLKDKKAPSTLLAREPYHERMKSQTAIADEPWMGMKAYIRFTKPTSED